MKFSLLLLFLGAGISVEAACKKDQCFNQVALKQFGAPGVAGRLADCRSFLRLTASNTRVVTISASVTGNPVTSTIVATVQTTVFTTVTTTSTSAYLITSTTKYGSLVTVTVTQTVTSSEGANTPRMLARKERDSSAQAFESRDSEISDEASELGARAAIIMPVNKIKPYYVGKCADATAYAIACLCYGAKQETVTAAPKTIRLTSTIRSTASNTVYVTAGVVTSPVQVTATNTLTITIEADVTEARTTTVTQTTTVDNRPPDSTYMVRLWQASQYDLPIVLLPDSRLARNFSAPNLELALDGPETQPYQIGSPENKLMVQYDAYLEVGMVYIDSPSSDPRGDSYPVICSLVETDGFQLICTVTGLPFGDMLTEFVDCRSQRDPSGWRGISMHNDYPGTLSRAGCSWTQLYVGLA